MNENTTKERKKTDIGMGVQMWKYLYHNSPVLQGNNIWNWGTESDPNPLYETDRA